MRYDDWTSLGAMAFEQAEQMGDQPFLWAKNGAGWRSTSFAEVTRGAASIGRTLKGLGIAPGDRVLLCAENRPEWLIAYLGILATRAIAVPAYTTNQVADHLHILANSGARGAICSTGDLAERLVPAIAEAPGAEFMIAIEPPELGHNVGVKVVDWRDAAGDTEALDEARAEVAKAKRTDTACLIYTSGTGGTPRGVMLSHGAILSNCKGAYKLLEVLGLDHEVFLSFLPLSHSYEHTAGLMFPLTIGAQIYYAEGADKLAANMVEVRPTIMTAVPRLYETMYGRIMRGIKQKGGISEKLFMKAVELGKRRYEDPASLGLFDRLADALLEKLVRDKVRARFGGRLKALVSGGAPLNYDIGLFFTALGLRLLQGYGQTESAPVVACNIPNRVKIDTVGPPVVDTEVKIAEDGEILVRGELVMQGYWGDEAATRETLRDGWLHTGDVGEIDGDGYIRITDRKKDIIVNSGGDNVSPQRIEGFLSLEPEVLQAMVYGDRKPHLVALIVPDPDFARSWAREKGKPAALETLVGDEDFREAVGDALERMNARLAPIERVRRFRLRAEPFTTDNEMMTPSLKIRRHKILEVHRPELEALY